MAELLLELLSEEIPARMQARAASDLVRLLTEGLARFDLPPQDARCYVTPRRLALVIDDLPTTTPDIEEERRGPRVGAPVAALDGFLKSAGIRADQCKQSDTGKGVFYVATIRQPGRRTAAILPALIESVLAEFPWPKSMRWGSHTVRWVRPLRSILCLFDGQVVPLTFGPVVAGNTTFGHRFLAPSRISVRSFADYAQQLHDAKVVLDAGQRRRMIVDQAQTLAARERLLVRQDEALLDEICGLVEWPVVLCGQIDPAFLDIPDEVLITSMRAHQKYLSLLRADGRLADRFLVVANTAGADDGQAIVAGNERVLRARLSDAQFFWKTDRKSRLDSRVAKLEERIFYQGLGTMAHKAARLEALAGRLAQVIGCDAEVAGRAARLAKADLSSEMVGEFPELQGIMGRYYALNDGEPPALADAIAEHYAPQGPGDRCPTAPISVAVALADKIDSLVGFFAIGEKPTGSKDPFALRRAALGIVRLTLENGVRLPLRDVFHFAHALYTIPLQRSAIETSKDLLGFIADRLKVHMKDQGARHDLVAAVFAQGDEDDLVRLVGRVESLKAFLATDDGSNLLIAFRRAANIVRIEEKKDGLSYGEVLPILTTESLPEEFALARGLESGRGEIRAAIQSEDFAGAMKHMAALREPIDHFFEKVTVNSSGVVERERRLRLLAQVRTVMNLVADFSCIEG